MMRDWTHDLPESYSPRVISWQKPFLKVMRKSYFLNSFANTNPGITVILFLDGWNTAQIQSDSLGLKLYGI